jgi:hypothetical protein
VLRDVEFAAQPWKNSVEQLTTFFDIAPKRVPLAPRDLKLRYETLWTHEEMKKERPLVRAQIEAARRVAAGMTRTSVYRPILNAITERFAEREMPLHPGEAQAIAKMMTYTLDEGMELEWGQDTVEQSRWFQSLCQVLAHDESVEEWDRGEIAVAYLLEAVLYDAILLGFTVIEPKIREDLGDLDERINYANRLLTWFASHGEPDLSYVYLPLVMGGVVVNQFITLRDENPWVMLEELREAYAGRIRLVTDTTQSLFDMLEDLLADAEETLRRMRIPPPG